MFLKFLLLFSLELKVKNIHLIYSEFFGVDNMFFKFSCGVFHHKFHTSLPKSFRHSVSNPKPNESFLRYSTTVNCSTFKTTVVLSFTFRSETSTTLRNMKKHIAKQTNVRKLSNVLFVIFKLKFLHQPRNKEADMINRQS